MSTNSQIALAQAKETAGTSLRINTVCNFQTVKSGEYTIIEYTIIKVPIVMSSGYSGKFSQRQYKIQLSRDSYGKLKVLER